MYKPTYLQHAFLTIYSRYTFRKDDLNICYQSLCQKKHQAPHPLSKCSGSNLPPRGRGFIKVLNRRATEFDTRVKNWQGPPGLGPWGGSGGMLPRRILKFYSRMDVFSCILKLQTVTFNNQNKITFLDNLIMI